MATSIAASPTPPDAAVIRTWSRALRPPLVTSPLKAVRCAIQVAAIVCGSTPGSALGGGNDREVAVDAVRTLFGDGAAITRSPDGQSRDAIVAGYHHDHLFVAIEDADRALQALNDLATEYRRQN